LDKYLKETQPQKALPALDEDFGQLSHDGSPSPLVIWGLNYSDYNDYVVKDERIWGNEFDMWEALANFEMDEVAPLVSGANSILETIDHIELNVKMLDITI
jgi:hypothetical protein